MRLLELFDTPVSYEWVADEPEFGGQADFKVGQLTYVFTIADERLPSGEPAWFIEFAATTNGSSPQYTNTGTGNQYLVYSTVLKLIKEYTTKNGLRPLMIGAEDDGRRSLYSRMLAKFLRGWKVVHSGNDIFAYPPGEAIAA